jgi:acyl carrier protein
MKREVVLANVIRIVADQFGFHDDEVTEDTTLDSLNADELDKTELAMEFENEFEIEISEDEEESMSSVGQLVDLVMGKLEAKTQAKGG